MFRSLLKYASFTAAALASVVAVPASATEYCDFLFNSHCTENCYAYVVPVDDPVVEAECDTLYAISSVKVTEAPADPRLDCSSNGNSYLCEAWPQSEAISYAWSGGQGDGSARSPFRSLSCAGGTLSVAVKSPSGAASHTSITLPACN